jgi:hypothetical protein
MFAPESTTGEGHWRAENTIVAGNDSDSGGSARRQCLIFPIQAREVATGGKLVILFRLIKVSS